VDFVTAVKTCLTKYVDFSGRATRSEYWWFYLFQLLVSVAANLLGSVFGLFALLPLLLLLPGLAAGARRLHDINRSGWWQLLVLTGIGILVLIYWWVQPSDESANDYGDPYQAV
jgi:uncharacterized membrane protein YhaH (DUF805 family)